MIIQNCIEWNKARALNAKTRTDRLRYEENIKNLEAMLEASNEEAEPVREGFGGY